ncbi:hypothetical protein B0T20DRAFT_389452 [Sordaria brevicollis]|uniref:Uncharacterized protein n=1 Tax=Sordaria brevicollis TaxID=83679 RepID=A0AAE0PKF9_SORBR|nr:hypothetical protein B0T20DRAFT_389452 [Sordaria brevicollis]
MSDPAFHSQAIETFEKSFSMSMSIMGDLRSQYPKGTSQLDGHKEGFLYLYGFTEKEEDGKIHYVCSKMPSGSFIAKCAYLAKCTSDFMEVLMDCEEEAERFARAEKKAQAEQEAKVQGGLRDDVLRKGRVYVIFLALCVYQSNMQRLKNSRGGKATWLTDEMGFLWDCFWGSMSVQSQVWCLILPYLPALAGLRISGRVVGSAHCADVGREWHRRAQREKAGHGPQRHIIPYNGHNSGMRGNDVGGYQVKLYQAPLRRPFLHVAGYDLVDVLVLWRSKFKVIR